MNRRLLVDRELALGDACIPAPGAAIAQMLDVQELRDGLPFLIEDDGTLNTLWSINQYMIDADSQRGLMLDSLARFHSYNLARALRFVRVRRAWLNAQAAGEPPEDWVAREGIPRFDLLEATRGDLTAYRDARIQEVKASSWNTELGSLTAFFDYALKSGWIDRTPVPRWSRAERNTLAVRDFYTREPKFLTEGQLRHFLKVGLRGDAATHPPRNRERDYAFGVLLSTTGLRREEGGRLLDCEVPIPDLIPSTGVWPFTRVGKGSQPRSIFVTVELATVIDFYRRTERERVILAAQRRLFRMKAEGRLLVCDRIHHAKNGSPVVVIGRRKIPADRLNDEQRAAAVVVDNRGVIRPLALFVGRYGLSPRLDAWDALFASARDRVAAANQPDSPPAHLVVAPHTFRHTYAVRMLAALMRVGRDTADDPYLLLANPVLTVMELLGHADVTTTQLYLRAAERYTDDLPIALRAVSASTVGHVDDADLATQDGGYS